MTAASYTLPSSVPLTRTSLRWTLALLAVCLPVPICAASGLSLPLPGTVERIAALLVPWTDGVVMSANEALRTGAAGSIVAQSDEATVDSRSRLAGVVTTARAMRSDSVGTGVMPMPGEIVPSFPGMPAVPGAPAPAPATPAPAAGPTQPADSGAAPSSPAAPGEAPAPAPGPAPTTTTEPTQPAVQSDPDPIAAVTPVVEEVLEPVAPTVVETTKTVVETVAPILPVLPGLGK